MNSALENELESSKTKKNNNLPNGTFAPNKKQQYDKICEYVLKERMYLVPCPFRYNYLNYVILHKESNKKIHEFQIFHEPSKMCLLRAVQVSNVIGCKYAIFDYRRGQKNSSKIIGYVRGNLMNNQFYLFDEGFNPKKNKYPIRKELAFIKFEKESLFSQGPSSGKCILPFWANYRDQQSLELTQSHGIKQKQDNKSQIMDKYKSNEKSVFSIQSQSASFNTAKKMYQMDFRGLVTQVSPFNCIMKTSSNQQCLVFGKRTNNTYIAYVGYPLNLIQAFGYILANFENKNV